MTEDDIRVKDEYISGLLDSLHKKSSYRIDTTLKEELDSYLSIVSKEKDKISKIPYGAEGLHDLHIIGVLLSKTQRYKDRVREIDLRFMELINSLNKLIKRLEIYLWSNYSDTLSALRPAARQQVFIESVIREVLEIRTDAELIRSKADTIIKNLTDTYWTLSKIEEIGLAFVNHKDYQA